MSYKADDRLLIESPSPGSTSIRGCLSSSTNQDFPPQPIVESRGLGHGTFHLIGKDIPNRAKCLIRSQQLYVLVYTTIYPSIWPINLWPAWLQLLVHLTVSNHIYHDPSHHAMC
jgi:hypothetical protein